MYGKANLLPRGVPVIWWPKSSMTRLVGFGSTAVALTVNKCGECRCNTAALFTANCLISSLSENYTTKRCANFKSLFSKLAPSKIAIMPFWSLALALFIETFARLVKINLVKILSLPSQR